jgi:ubiquinone/menaquinone biosynthesis C-methylase UbiE
VNSPTPVGDDRAYLDFVLGMKQYFATTVYEKLHDQYASARVREKGQDAGEVRIDRLSAYPLFEWLERNTQKMMWRRLEGMIRPYAAELEASLGALPEQPQGSLHLDPGTQLPAYYTETEFHIQPGGVWSGAANTFVYEVGAKIVMLGQNDDYQFHRVFVETGLPRRPYRDILDLGCGFGKSTRPLVDAFPEARIVGIDLSASNLKLAHQQAERLRKPIAFYQRAAEATGFDDASFDLVTATMLIHELPMPVLRQVLIEARRVLRPGGELAVLDFARTGDVLLDDVMEGHGARNNEPYLPHLFKTDVPRLLSELGFESSQALPFDERGAGLREDGTWPTRAEWHFPWVVIRATKP